MLLLIHSPFGFLIKPGEQLIVNIGSLIQEQEALSSCVPGAQALKKLQLVPEPPAAFAVLLKIEKPAIATKKPNLIK